MAFEYFKLLLASCLVLMLARCGSSTVLGVPQGTIFEGEETPDLGGMVEVGGVGSGGGDSKMVHTREVDPEKVERYVRLSDEASSPSQLQPADRPGRNGQLRPFERPGPSDLLRPFDRPGPTGQLRPMLRPDVPMERSRGMPGPVAPAAEQQVMALADAGGARVGQMLQAPKPGQCPVTVCTGEHSITNKLDCMSDDQCPGADKCCLDPCNPARRVCSRAGHHVHPGSCPAQESCYSEAFVYKVICQDDVQCSPDTKCCYDKCISHYVCKPSARPSPPGPVWPPAPSPPGPVWPPTGPVWPPIPPNPGWPLPPSPGPSRPQQCSYYCPGTLQCCDHITRPGYCPASAYCYSAQQERALSSYDKHCDSDMECSRTDKCCFDQCLERMMCRPMVFDSKAHPGQCPAPTPRCQQTQIEERKPCTDDRSCSLHERCCSSPCYRTLVCTAALNGLPQPPVSPPQPPGPEPNECATLCPGSEHCCDGVEKYGFCPAPGKCVGALIHPPKTCSYDYDCEDSDKCCQDSCTNTKVCRAAVASATVHPGTCPALSASCTGVRPLTSSQPQPNDCSQDIECTMEQRCCHDACQGRKNCQYTNVPQPPAPKPCKVYCQGSKECCDEEVKDGYCPAPYLCEGTMLNPIARCLQDYDCSEAAKCCLDSCTNQMYCRPAVPHPAVHPGSCPATPPTCVGYNASNKKQCTSDSECRFEQRCCFDGCLNRKSCLRTEENSITPNPPGPPQPPAPPTCSFFCPGTKECCDDKSKNGFCPATSACAGALINPLPRCTNDYQCSGEEKCCFDRCEKGMVCRPATNQTGVHPGQCPLQAACPTTNIKKQAQCASDSSCRFEHRCCYDECHRYSICKAADTTITPPSLPGCTVPCPFDPTTCCDTLGKPGYCPWPANCQSGSTSVGPQTSCQGTDYTCPDTQKCCYDNCQGQSYCRPSVNGPYEHTGVCPQAQTSCISLNPTSSSACGNDSWCPSDEKCCYDSCENKKICKKSYVTASKLVSTP